MRRLLPLLAVAATLTAAAPATAATKGCRSVTARVGDAPVRWTAHHIRLTRGFRCRDARQNIRTWIRYGGYMDHPRALAPWRCNFGRRNRCRLRTSFGGTRPERVYYLRFRLR